MNMGYLKDLYGTSSADFIDGIKAGIELYAHWHDGEQFVGTTVVTLKEALAEVNKEFMMCPKCRSVGALERIELNINDKESRDYQSDDAILICNKCHYEIKK